MSHKILMSLKLKLGGGSNWTPPGQARVNKFCLGSVQNLSGPGVAEFTSATPEKKYTPPKSTPKKVYPPKSTSKKVYPP